MGSQCNSTGLLRLSYGARARGALEGVGCSYAPLRLPIWHACRWPAACSCSTLSLRSSSCMQGPSHESPQPAGALRLRCVTDDSSMTGAPLQHQVLCPKGQAQNLPGCWNQAGWPAFDDCTRSNDCPSGCWEKSLVCTHTWCIHANLAHHDQHTHHKATSDGASRVEQQRWSNCAAADCAAAAANCPVAQQLLAVSVLPNRRCISMPS